jgi:hypothetical protein
VRLAETADVPTPGEAASQPEAYDVLLLAGTPRRHTCLLPGDIAAGASIDLDGEEWTVADVRTTDAGPTRLICIYAA